MHVTVMATCMLYVCHTCYSSVDMHGTCMSEVQECSMHVTCMYNIKYHNE